MAKAITTTAQCGPIATGGTGTLTFDLEYRTPAEGQIVLDLQCTTADGETWQRSASVTMRPPTGPSARCGTGSAIKAALPPPELWLSLS